MSWWSGNVTGGLAKTIPLADWGPVFAEPDLAFVNLQYGDAVADLGFAETGMATTIHQAPGLDCTDDIEGLVALIRELDVVVTVSNVTAHFAGAVGTETWLMLPTVPLWHWFHTARRDSLWYPGFRVYRRKPNEEWGRIMRAVARDLGKAFA